SSIWRTKPCRCLQNPQHSTISHAERRRMDSVDADASEEVIKRLTVRTSASMKTAYIFTLAFSVALFSGCDSPRVITPIMATPEYAAKEPIATSLFPSDQAVLGDEAVGRILSSKLVIRAKAKLGLTKFPEGDV